MSYRSSNLADEDIALLHSLYTRYGLSTFPVSVTETNDPRLNQLVRLGYVRQVGWPRGRNPHEMLYAVTREGELSFAARRSRRAHAAPFRIPRL